MGMFDQVRCRYPLPDPEAQDLEFQTKSTPAPFHETYEITSDGRLLHAIRDDDWTDHPAVPSGSSMESENPRWEPVSFRGQLEIHTVHECRWYSYLLWFRSGRVVDLQHGPGHGELLPDRPLGLPRPPEAG